MNGAIGERHCNFGKISQRGGLVQYGYIIGEWGGPISQWRNWRTEGNSTSFIKVCRLVSAFPGLFTYSEVLDFGPRFWTFGHSNNLSVTDPFWTVTVDIALDSLRTHTGTQTRH